MIVRVASVADIMFGDGFSSEDGRPTRWCVERRQCRVAPHQGGRGAKINPAVTVKLVGVLRKGSEGRQYSCGLVKADSGREGLEQVAQSTELRVCRPQYGPKNIKEPGEARIRSSRKGYRSGCANTT